MKSIAIAAGACALILSTAATVQNAPGWRTGFGQGITEFLTGEWDSKTGGSLLISCRPNGTAALSLQIAGKQPVPNEAFTLSITGTGARMIELIADQAGGYEFGAAAESPQLAKLWSALRSGSNVTIAFNDGSRHTRSLADASKVLGAKPCTES